MISLSSYSYRLATHKKFGKKLLGLAIVRPQRAPVRWPKRLDRWPEVANLTVHWLFYSIIRLEEKMTGDS